MPEKYKTKKVLIVSDWFALHTGFANSGRHLADWLYNASWPDGTPKFKVVYHGWYYNQGFNTGITRPYKLYKTMQAPGVNDKWGQESFPKVIEEEKPDIVIGIGDVWMVEHINRVKNRKTFKFVLYMIVDGEPIPRQMIADRTYRIVDWEATIKGADYVVSHGPFSEREIERITHKGICAAQIGYGIEPDVFKPAENLSEKREVRRQSFPQIPKDAFLLGFFSRNQPRKALDKLMHAVALFQHTKEDPKRPLYLYLHCDINDYSGWNIPELIKFFRVKPKRVISDASLKIGKGLPEDKLRDKYIACDATALPTRGEGWGVCLGPDSIVPTAKEALFIPEVKPGDKVLGKDGKFHKVLDTTSRSVDSIYKVRPQYSEEILVTKEHPFYVSSDGGKTADWKKVGDIQKEELLGVVKPKTTKKLPTRIDLAEYLPEGWKSDDQWVWHPMGFSPKTDLSFSDIAEKYNETKKIVEKAVRYIRDPECGISSERVISLANRLSKDNYSPPEPQKVKRYLPITKETLEFIGWYCAEGSSDGGSRLELDVHKDEIPILERLAGYLNEAMRAEYTIEQNGENMARLRISNAAIATAFKGLCGDGAPNKHIPYEFEGCWDQLGPVLKGILSGDGYFNNRKLILTTTSKTMVHQIRNACLANGIMFSISSIPVEKQVYGSHVSYTGTVSVHHLNRWIKFTGMELDVDSASIEERATRFVETDDYFFVPIRSIEKEAYDGLVYDLHVEDSHSFVAQGILVHNTILESMACGVPVLTTNYSAHADYCGPGSLFIKPACMEMEPVTNIQRCVVSVNDFVEKIDQLYNDKDLRYRLGRDGRKQALNYTWDDQCRKWEELIDSIDVSDLVKEEDNIAKEIAEKGIVEI